MPWIYIISRVNCKFIGFVSLPPLFADASRLFSTLCQFDDTFSAKPSRRRMGGVGVCAVALKQTSLRSKGNVPLPPPLLGRLLLPVLRQGIALLLIQSSISTFYCSPATPRSDDYLSCASPVHPSIRWINTSIVQLENWILHFLTSRVPFAVPVGQLGLKDSDLGAVQCSADRKISADLLKYRRCLVEQPAGQGISQVNGHICSHGALLNRRAINKHRSRQSQWPR